MQALAVSLSQFQLLPMKRIQEFCGGLLGCQLSEGILADWIEDAARTLGPILLHWSTWRSVSLFFRECRQAGIWESVLAVLRRQRRVSRGRGPDQVQRSWTVHRSRPVLCVVMHVDLIVGKTCPAANDMCSSSVREVLPGYDELWSASLFL